MTSRILRYAKFAEEAEVGTKPAEPDFTIDIASSGIDVPSDSQIMWEGGIGRGPRTHRPGYYHVDGNVVAPVDIHTVASFLRWALGGYAFTSEGGPDLLNLHEAYGATDLVLPSFTTWLGKDLFEQIVTGCMASQLQLQVSDGYAQLTVDVLGGKDAKGTIDQAVLAKLPLPPPLTFPAFHLWVGGTGTGDEVSKKITDLTLTVNNHGDAGAARGLGSRFPQREIPAGQRDTTLQFTTFYDSTDHIERVWGSPEGPSDDGSTELPLRMTADSGPDGELTVDLPRVIFTQVQTQPSGRSRIDQQVNATALLDTITLEDGTTEVESEIYVKVANDRDEIGAA